MISYHSGYSDSTKLQNTNLDTIFDHVFKIELHDDNNYNTLDQGMGRDFGKKEGEHLIWCLKAVKQEHKVAQYRSRFPNESKAAGWCRKSAEQGFRKAQNSLTKCYDDGRGVLRLSQRRRWDAARRRPKGARRLGVTCRN